MSSIKLIDLCKYFKGLNYQMAAISELEEAINKANPHILGREQAWFKTWSQGGKQVDLDAALKLIKQFEGCHLDAYPDPLSGGDPWTIGYGTTRYKDGRRVSRGDKINAIEADLLLRQEVDSIAEKLRTTVPFWVAMANHRQCALISFAYNLGSSFYGNTGFETISKRLRDKDWAGVPDALLLYRNPGSNVEAGLKRRRIAEGDLWGRDKQVAGSMPNPLPTPYQSQRDNYRDASRTCFSSSCAMLLMTLKPGAIHSDDEYIKTVFSIGDTTDASVQIKALRHYGVSAQFRTNGNRALIQKQIDAGKPVPAGFLHHGTSSAPSGGGHWLCIIGYDNERGSYIVNDPWGAMNVASGVYSSTSGAKQLYPYATWEPRWMPDGPSSGWCIVA
jgi:GH24 family phage-related lysozyme (muramidase)